MLSTYGKQIFKIKCTKNLYKSIFQSQYAKEELAHLSIPELIWPSYSLVSKSVE